jgi:hypothetical protein
MPLFRLKDPAPDLIKVGIQNMLLNVPHLIILLFQKLRKSPLAGGNGLAGRSLP